MFSFCSNNLFLEDFKVLLISFLNWDVDLVPGGISHPISPFVRFKELFFFTVSSDCVQREYIKDDSSLPSYPAC